jgi:hypothetical protein
VLATAAPVSRGRCFLLYCGREVGVYDLHKPRNLEQRADEAIVIARKTGEYRPPFWHRPTQPAKLPEANFKQTEEEVM